jgi:hypothetical protein
MKEDLVYFIDGDNKIHDPSNSHAEISELESNEPQSAINPDTGEINWDCPCLKSALEPPCGEFFKAAFSCFVASNADPKGADCLEKFSAMQDCFRAHPEVYSPSDDNDPDELEGAVTDLNTSN